MIKVNYIQQWGSPEFPSVADLDTLPGAIIPNLDPPISSCLERGSSTNQVEIDSIMRLVEIRSNTWGHTLESTSAMAG